MIPIHLSRVLAVLTFAILAARPLVAAGASNPKAEAGAPGIAEQPIARNVSEGGHVTLSLSVTGAAPLAFQWWKNSEPLANNARITGATGPVLNIDPANTNDTGNYFAIVTNNSGAVTSAAVSIACLRLPVSLTVRGNTGLFVRVFGQVGDVYRIESANDPNLGPWMTNAYATNYNGVAGVFVPFAGLGNFLRARFDHFRPVLYAPEPGDSTHVVRAYGKLNQAWQLQGALNLPNWEAASPPQTNTTGWVKFRENSASNPARRFYRIVPP